MRCYLVSEYPCDLTTLREALHTANIEPVGPDFAFQRVSANMVHYWFPEVDFVLVVFPVRSDLETPPALLLDIGVAIGKNVPVLLIAEPSRKIYTALAPLPLVNISLNNGPALSERIKQFANSIGGQIRPVGEDAPTIDPRVLDAFRIELDALHDLPIRPAESEYRFMEIALRLLRAGGADLEVSNRDYGSDAAGWIPGTEDFFRDPILFEFKLVRQPRVAKAVLDQLSALTSRHGAALAVVIYFSPNREQIKWPESISPTIIAFEINELVQQLRDRSLAAVLRTRRNVVVHGGPAR